MGATAASDVTSIQLLDRDLSWLEFNWRVLHEALDARTPLLERVEFLAIFSSNLDEFFMKRIGALKRRIAIVGESASGAETARQRLTRLREVVLGMLEAQAEVYTSTLRPELARHGIHLVDWAGLTERQRAGTRDYFRQTVYPVLTPLAVDSGHPFPFMSNLSTSLGILLHPPDTDERLFARVKVPDVLPQWVRVLDDGEGGRLGTRQSLFHCSS